MALSVLDDTGIFCDQFGLLYPNSLFCGIHGLDNDYSLIGFALGHRISLGIDTLDSIS